MCSFRLIKERWKWWKKRKERRAKESEALYKRESPKDPVNITTTDTGANEKDANQQTLSPSRSAQSSLLPPPTRSELLQSSEPLAQAPLPMETNNKSASFGGPG